jgi:hypothetical protein
MRAKQRLLEVPASVTVVDFIRFDGRSPVDPTLSVRKDTTLVMRHISMSHFAFVAHHINVCEEHQIG